ncbi:hypothetical protein BJ546DRAFT_838554 [Cryomyces antarcticus]
MRSSPVLLLTTLLPLLATSTSTPPLHRYRLALAPRAGAPAIVPIPADCTVTNPLPPSNNSNTTTTYAPSPNATVSLLYAFYLAQPILPNTSALFTQCLEQCYGYGLPGSCRSAVLAENVPVPGRAATAGAGGAGATGGGSADVLLGTACLMFSRVLGTVDWVVADKGTWTAERAGVIECPG